MPESTARVTLGQKREPEGVSLSILPFATTTCQQLPHHPESQTWQQSQPSEEACGARGRTLPGGAPGAACYCSRPSPAWSPQTDSRGRKESHLPRPPQETREPAAILLGRDRSQSLLRPVPRSSRCLLHCPRTATPECSGWRACADTLTLPLALGSGCNCACSIDKGTEIQRKLRDRPKASPQNVVGKLWTRATGYRQHP